MKKIIFYNLLILYLIISAIIIFSPLAMDIYRFNSAIKDESTKHTLPNYSKTDWAKQHFTEFKKLRTTYYDYIIHRRNDYKGKTITIKNGFRLNHQKENFKLEKDIWIFGGSTVWGSGSIDYGTIPALFEKKTGRSTLNLGEAGYNSTQELNFLLKNLILHKPKVIIFYDGVNDVEHKCRSDSNFYATEYEQILQNIIGDPEYTIHESFKHSKKLFEPPLKIINYFKKSFFKSKNKIARKYDCDTNEEKRYQVVKSLVRNWQIVKSISDREKIKFIPILQPIAYTTKSKTEHLKIKESDELKKQYKILYPEIKKELKRLQFRYIDLEKSLNDDQYYFIDFCHLSPNGNMEIVNKIISHKLYTE